MSTGWDLLLIGTRGNSHFTPDFLTFCKRLVLKFNWDKKTLTNFDYNMKNELISCLVRSKFPFVMKMIFVKSFGHPVSSEWLIKTEYGAIATILWRSLISNGVVYRPSDWTVEHLIKTFHFWAVTRMPNLHHFKRPCNMSYIIYAFYIKFQEILSHNFSL